VCQYSRSPSNRRFFWVFRGLRLISVIPMSFCRFVISEGNWMPNLSSFVSPTCFHRSVAVLRKPWFVFWEHFLTSGCAKTFWVRDFLQLAASLILDLLSLGFDPFPSNAQVENSFFSLTFFRSCRVTHAAFVLIDIPQDSFNWLFATFRIFLPFPKESGAVLFEWFPSFPPGEQEIT